MRLLSRFLTPVGIPAVLAVVSAAGCTIGGGTGSATGPLWIEGCLEGEPYGTPAAPEMFDLEPTFFAGEPIGDISDGIPANRLIIRMQRTGNELQISDTLFFDIPNSRRVAQCVRGQMLAGVPQWDTSSGTVDPLAPPWCEPNGPAGMPRINLIPFGPVRSALTPLATCHSEAHQPAVVSITGVARSGWIDFVHFGHAAQPDDAPDARDPVEDSFQVAFGERLQATFQVVLDDDRVLTAEHKGIEMPPAPRIGGTLDGDFDFDLERGRSAQTFP